MMAIKEKPRDLEFTYYDSNDIAQFEVKFSEDTRNVLITSVSGSITGSICANNISSEVLAEVVDFLRENKAIEPLLSLSLPKGGSGQSNLAIPVIEIKADTSIPSLPFSSFNREQDSAVSNVVKEGKEEEEKKEVEKEPKKEGIYVDGKKVEKATARQRPVITSKTTQEADMLRGGIADPDTHSIKSNHH